MEIIGHEEMREKLRRQIVQDKVSHAYLFSGKDGIGKRKVAIEFAKNMLCLSPIEGKSCGNCEACLTFESGADFCLVEPEDHLIKVDRIRHLEEEIYLKPTHAQRKCFVINEAETMNESAQNALLKVLEEPPHYATIILVTGSKQKLLRTIRSRVVEVGFYPLKEQELTKILGKDFNANIISYASGSVSQALRLADDKEIEVAESLVKVFQTKDFLKISHEVESLKSDKSFKQKIESILETMNLVCYHKLRENVSMYTRFIQIIEDTNNKLQKNANLDLTLDNMMIQICYK